jgi:hypothetical protein
MMKRVPSCLIMCVAESLRDIFLFYSFLSFLTNPAIGAPMLFCLAFAPALAIPIAWFYLWLDCEGHDIYLKLIGLAKTLSLCAGFFWVIGVLARAKETIFSSSPPEQRQLLLWVFIVVADWVLAGFTFRLQKTLAPAAALPANQRGGVDRVIVEEIRPSPPQREDT